MVVTASVELVGPGGVPALPAGPTCTDRGAHVDVQIMVAGRPEIRSYSVARRDPNDPCVLMLGIQAAADSRGGSLAMSDLAPAPG